LDAPSVDDLALYDDARGHVTAPTRFPVHRRGELEQVLGDLGFLFVVAMRVRWQRREHPPHTRGNDLWRRREVFRLTPGAGQRNTVALAGIAGSAQMGPQAFTVDEPIADHFSDLGTVIGRTAALVLVVGLHGSVGDLLQLA
jgi:hypothetical protein